MKELDYLERSILIDDVEVLREEQDALYEKWFDDNYVIHNEIQSRVAEARQKGIEV